MHIESANVVYTIFRIKIIESKCVNNKFAFFWLLKLGEACKTPDNTNGICIELPQCSSLFELYGSSKQNTQDDTHFFFKALGYSCDEDKIQPIPLVCCNDPSVTGNDSETMITEATTEKDSQLLSGEYMKDEASLTEITELSTTTMESLKKAIIHFPSTRSDETCTDPNGLPGVCKSIKECSFVLNELGAKENDTSYVQYLQQSNTICNFIIPNICCPHEDQQSSENNLAAATESEIVW